MGLPKYVLNWDELTAPLKKELLKLIDDAIKDKYPEINTDNIEADLEAILELLPSDHYEDLKRKIDAFIYKNIVGIQKIEGVYLDIPPLVKSTQHDFKYDKDVYLTGLHVDQNGWKKEDRWRLVINKVHLMKNVATKEVGEHKFFNTFYKVNANTPISFILDNNSGNSREIMLDLEYIEGDEITINPPSTDLPPSGSTILFLDVSGSMWGLCDQMSNLMVTFLQNLSESDTVSVCFVSGIDDKHTKGTYFYEKHDFSNKDKAMEFLGISSNIPKKTGGTYDIVTVKAVLDYNLNKFTNYVFCTDQLLESAPRSDFKTKLISFFTEKQNVYSIPTEPSFIYYWDDVFNNTGLFKPIKI
ncbi:hypothetical protein JOC70_000761 [Clostridium pascui]|uniref:hypothetical protein n=1 Tax=Clostridium pascui TaxID=46609 RepID=UPI00195B7BA3|nr:hypothetical protein [Clostridium pascui]MBM7869292.1 hypothetical protein [Clostridium pascui]